MNDPGEMTHETWPPDQSALDRARLSRDPRFDGRFFIGVTSTGIYCRPICPAPSPKQANVRYFPTAAAAHEAGFRPCLRCRPEAAPGTSAWLGTTSTVRRALRHIDDGALDRGSVEDLAERLGIGPRHLHRLFVEHLGASPIAVAQTRRLHFAKRLIDDTDLPMSEIADASGFGSLRRFNAVFSRVYGRPPRELRKVRAGAPEGDSADLALRLAYRAPYDWDGLLRFLGTRCVPGVEQVDGDTYRRTLAVQDRAIVVEAHPARGTKDALELRVRHAVPAVLHEVVSRARRVFDVAADPALIAATLSRDPALADAVRARPGLRIPGAFDAFELAVRAILGQQVSVAAARTLAARLVARCGTPWDSGADGLTHLFPTPAQVAAADLAGMGLTGSRVIALQTLAAAVSDRQIDLGGEPETLAEQLHALPGIGPWTIEYLLLRGSGHPDAFPAGDLVLRRALEPGVTLGERALAMRAEAWRPWRGYAVFHLWSRAVAAAAPQRSPSAKGTRRH